MVDALSDTLLADCHAIALWSTNYPGDQDELFFSFFEFFSFSSFSFLFSSFPFPFSFLFFFDEGLPRKQRKVRIKEKIETTSCGMIDAEILWTMTTYSAPWSVITSAPRSVP